MYLTIHTCTALLVLLLSRMQNTARSHPRLAARPNRSFVHAHEGAGTRYATVRSSFHSPACARSVTLARTTGHTSTQRPAQSTPHTRHAATHTVSYPHPSRRRAAFPLRYVSFRGTCALPQQPEESGPTVGHLHRVRGPARRLVERASPRRAQHPSRVLPSFASRVSLRCLWNAFSSGWRTSRDGRHERWMGMGPASPYRSARSPCS